MLLMILLGLFQLFDEGASFVLQFGVCLLQISHFVLQLTDNTTFLLPIILLCLLFLLFSADDSLEVLLFLQHNAFLNRFDPPLRMRILIVDGFVSKRIDSKEKRELFDALIAIWIVRAACALSNGRTVGQQVALDCL